MREKIENIINENACYATECVSKMSTAILKLISELLPKEKEVTKYKECNLCKDRWINEEDKGFNKALKIIRERLGV